MTITIQLDVGELKELLNGRTKSVLEDFVAPAINTRLCVRCNAEFTPSDDDKHYCPACQGKRKKPP